ncbi:MAG: hypothetical protein KAV00_14315, partial [Phycisphaerae bacterium]|nr:hypothetical protein [Phycisphaerae bacterium]
AANIEKAEVDSSTGVSPVSGCTGETPVLPTEEVHTPGAGTIEEVCDFLKTKPAEMIKTIVYWERDNTVMDVYKKTLTKFQTHSGQIEGLRDKFEELRGKSEPIISEIEASPNMEASPDWDKFVSQSKELVLKSFPPKSTAFYESGIEFIKARDRLANTAVMVLVRGNHNINESKLNRALGKNVEIAPEQVVQLVSRAKIGFAGPVGMWDKMDKFVKANKLIIDHSIAAMPVGVAGANKTDYHVRNVVPGRDFPLEGDNVIVADIRNAVEGDTHDGKTLQFSRGIEIGHVFKLGTKYSEKLGATYLDENGSAKPCVMGCYGIGINRIIAAAIEVGNDKNGCILPPAIAPFEVEVMILNNDSAEVVAEAERIYNELAEAGADVLLDDRDTRAGAKFKDADLIGIPLRVVVGERGLKEGNVEIKRRTDDKPTMVATKEAVAQTLKILSELKSAIRNPQSAI